MKTMGNKFTAKRHFLIRPKVCKSEPAKHAITSPSVPICVLTPTHPTIDLGDHVTFTLSFCLGCEPIGNPVDITSYADSGWFSPISGSGNCNAAVIDWTPDEPGVFAILFECKWWSGAVCNVSALVTVNP